MVRHVRPIHGDEATLEIHVRCAGCPAVINKNGHAEAAQVVRRRLNETGLRELAIAVIRAAHLRQRPFDPLYGVLVRQRLDTGARQLQHQAVDRFQLLTDGRAMLLREVDRRREK